MTANNVDSILELYFEADRSSTQRDYELLFGAISHSIEDAHGITEKDDIGDDAVADEVEDVEDQVPAEDELPLLEEGLQAVENNFDSDFNAIIAGINKPDAAIAQIHARWERFNLHQKIIAYHYLESLLDGPYTYDHGAEGFVVCFGTCAASQFLHSIFPELWFPISGDLTHRRLLRILELLGVEVRDTENQTEFEAWRSISQAVGLWGQERSLEPWQLWAAVYDLGPRLLPLEEPYSTNRPPRVWVIATNDSWGEFQEIDQHGVESVGAWAINKRAKRGDLALMYCVAPRSAVVGVYRVVEDSHYDPFGGWNGFRAEVSEKIAIPWVRISDMKKDPILKNWKLVRGNFQGLLKYEVPEDVWQRLIEIVTANDAETGSKLCQLGSAAHGARELRLKGEKWTERQFEERAVVPLFERLGWTHDRTLVPQVEMLIKVGSGRPQKVRADFVGYSGELTSHCILVVEAKRRISNHVELDFAAQQAESYAGRLRCSRYVVTSPEGIWIYELNFPGQSHLLASFEIEDCVTEEIVQKLAPLVGYECLRNRRTE